jgi:uncharacterized membrane protein YphA (DoxX/SURF4 family)
MAGAFEQVPRWVLVIPRLYVGVVFLAAGAGQLAGSEEWTLPGQGWPASMHAQIVAWIPQSASWYSAFETNSVLPHTDVLAPALAMAHLVIGLALVLGVWTRLVAVMAALLLLNYAAAEGTALYGAGEPSAYLALLLAVWLGRGGETLGVDAILASRRTKGGSS